ncbi:MAG: hypothetical protein IJY20_04120 [Clostridia bacterium]|nr:hypothetical protein [Clostridia bacterium]
MNEPTKTKRSPILLLTLILLGMALLNVILSALSTIIKDSVAVLMISFACELLSLFVTVIGFGAALFYLSRAESGLACRLLLLANVISMVPLLYAAVQTAIDNPDLFADALIIGILSAIGNTILMLGFHLLLLLICWLLFFRNKAPQTDAPRLLPRQNRLALSNLIVIGVMFIYQIIGVTIDAVDFISEYWPTVYPNEIASIVFDYIFVVASLLLGYLIQHITQALLYEADTQA